MTNVQASMTLPIQEIAAAVAEQLTPVINQLNQNNKGYYEEYLTREEVGKLIKLSPPTLNLYTQKGLIKAYKIGKRVLYKRAEIDEALRLMFNPKFQ